MSAEYSVEEVRAQAKKELRSGVHSKSWDMLNAYADLLERIKADEGAVDDKEKALADWGKSLNRRVEIETELFDCADGKRPLPTAEDCRRMALRLGTPDRHPPAQAAQVDALPDPLGCNDCTHPDCGRYNGPRSVECRAMLNNACARPAGNQSYRAPTAKPVAQVDEAESRLAAADTLLRLCAGNVSNPLVLAIQNHLQGTAKPAAQGEAVAFKHPAAVRSAATFLLGKFEHAPCDSSGVSCCVRCSAVAMSRWAVEALDASLSAQPRAVPDGWVLVPSEPTVTMLDAALKLQGDDAFLARAPAVLSAFVKIYKAMLAAAGVPSHDA